MNTTATQIVDADKIAILRLLADGRDLGFARAANMHLSEEQIRQIAQSHGYPDKAKMAWAVDEIRKHVDARARGSLPPPTVAAAPAQPAQTRPRPQPADEPRPRPAFDATADLLLKAASHPRVRVQQLGKKVSDQLAQLRDAIARAEADEKAKRAAAERRAAEKRSRDRARQQMREEVARLERELAAARQKLRGKPAAALRNAESAHPGSEPTRADRLRETFRAKADAQLRFLDRHAVTSRDVRDWAAANSVPCPPTGLIPGSVCEAYDAHQEAKAS